jgi:hypothetical protein
MPDPLFSEDGFWKFENGQWVASEKQISALSEGATPHEHSIADNQNVVSSDSDFPTLEKISITEKKLDTMQEKPLYKRKSVIFGTGFIAITIVLIMIISAQSPGTISLLDELRDSDGDGISDYDELEQGTDPMLKDTDNDQLTDDLDDCPSGEVNWESNLFQDWDGDGCKDSTEDLDDDNDGITDDIDQCDNSNILWDWTPETDNDEDGCHDDGDLDDDNDGWTDIKEIQCGTNSLRSYDYPDDLDGDEICDFVDDDDDNDGVEDSSDLFPRNHNEWADFDEDGIGDNEDTDDDNDGIADIFDSNDYADVGLSLRFDFFELFTQMDYFDTNTELYICAYVDSVNSGCVPPDKYWSIETFTYYSLDAELYIDIDDSDYSNLIQICAFDDDYSEDDYIDINPSNEYNCYSFDLNNGRETGYSETIIASGVTDSTGWDGELTFTYTLVDLREQRSNTFVWDYDGEDFSLTYLLEYSDYTYFKNLDHSVDYYDISTYARFATPSEQYVVSLAGTLESMAVQNGYTSELEIAEFVYAFVGDIQYVLDIEGSNVSEYPKYPIEMLWEASGDCEDAAILYISLIEALDYDAMLAVGLVKQSSDDDWGGHAWAVVNIEDDSVYGTYYWGLGEESDLRFFFVETTAYSDGTSYIGRDPWYDIDDVELYDVE